MANLPPGIDEQQLLCAAAERDVGLYGMSPYRSGRLTEPPALVVGYGPLSESAIELAISWIADLLDTWRNG